MTTPAELCALAERVTKLQGPCRETDAEIAIALYGGEIFWITGNGTMEMIPSRRYVSAAHIGGFGRAPVDAVTASLDAAVALVPEGWDWSMATDRRYCPSASVYLPDERGVNTDAATPALALTAAALLARAQMMEDAR